MAAALVASNPSNQTSKIPASLRLLRGLPGIMNSTEIYRAVREQYSAASRGSTDGKYESAVAASFGYSEEDLKSVPKGANLGLSCGNPLAIAGLKEGEVAVDFGSGAGFDVFLASKAVGGTGKAIGVDMNDDMLAKANRNKDLTRARNVEFVRAQITDVSPLPNDSTDCIISNCVVNLVPEAEKQSAFNEMARLLRPGGRVAISDILLKKDLTPDLKKDLALYVGCVAGASKVQAYEDYLHSAGFKDVLIVNTENDLNVCKDHSLKEESAPCCTKPCSRVEQQDKRLNSSIEGAAPPPEIDYNEYAGSFKIYAVKA